MNFRDVLRVWWAMRRKEGRNVRELELYTTDDLRRIYQVMNDDPIRLRTVRLWSAVIRVGDLGCRSRHRRL
jgi:hypothetical protein